MGRAPVRAEESGAGQVGVRLQALCEGAGLDSEVKASIVGFEPSFADQAASEFFLSLSGNSPQIGVLLEPSAAAPLEASRAFAERLEQKHGVVLESLRLVEDLFLPEELSSAFVQFAVSFAGGRAPVVRAYFNPQVRGGSRAYALVEQALLRLGFAQAWPRIVASIAKRGPRLDELAALSVELSPLAESAVRVYVRHHTAAPERLREATNDVWGDALPLPLPLLEAASEAPVSFLEFRERTSSEPSYISQCVLASTENPSASAQAWFVEHGLSAFAWSSETVTEGTGGIRLALGRKVVEGRGQESELSVHLSAREGAIVSTAATPAPFASAEEVVRSVSAFSLSDHPFVQRVGREPDNGGYIWQLIRNTYEGTSIHFVRWLATVTARVEDDAMRCLLARQLDQELGEGDITRAHSVLMGEFMRAIEPMRPATFEDTQLDSGRRLGQRLNEHYMSADPYEGAAALMAGEICAEQLIRAVARLLRAAPRPFDPSMLLWLTEHDELEGGHADESIVLARMVPATPEAVASVERGAIGLQNAIWESLDELYSLCFGQVRS